MRSISAYTQIHHPRVYEGGFLKIATCSKAYDQLQTRQLPVLQFRPLPLVQTKDRLLAFPDRTSRRTHVRCACNSSLLAPQALV
jgi:hypothetical protein